MSEVKKTIEQIVEEIKSGMITPDAVKQIAKEIGEAQVEELKSQLNEANEAVKAQGLKIAAMESKSDAKKETSIKSIYAENLDAIKGAVSSKREFTLELKADVLRSSVTNSTQSMRLPDIGDIARNRVMIASLFRAGSVSPNSNGVIRYVDLSAETLAALATSEGSTLPESSYTWADYTAKVEKIGTTIPVSEEAIADVDFMESEIRRLLEIDVMQEENSELWSGSGTTPHLKGVYTTAATFDSTDAAYFQQVQDGSIYDLLISMANKISKSKSGKYMPNVVCMNSTTAMKMKLKKDKDNNYIVPPFTMNNGMTVDGMTVIVDDVITDNTLLVGDFRFGTLYTMGGVEITVGHGSSKGKFEDDMLLIKARKRMCLLIRNADADAFLKSTDVATDVANITAV